MESDKMLKLAEVGELISIDYYLKNQFPQQSKKEIYILRYVNKEKEKADKIQNFPKMWYHIEVLRQFAQLETFRTNKLEKL